MDEFLQFAVTYGYGFIRCSCFQTSNKKKIHFHNAKFGNAVITM